MSWVDQPVPSGAEVEVQMSAHGRPVAAVWGTGGVVRFCDSAGRQRPPAPGQSVVLYDGDSVLGGGLAC
jgi:tRNA U34 2-thiouridine synthase MnmA/TrmU